MNIYSHSLGLRLPHFAIALLVLFTAGSGVSRAASAEAAGIAGQPSSPALAVSPNQLVFPGVAGQTCNTPRTLTVAAADDEAINWSLTSNVPWLQVTANGGTTPSQISIVANCAGLPVGVHQGLLTITPSSGPAQSVSVQLVINPSVPVRVATWKDGRRGAFSVSTDDGYLSGFTELVANGRAGTFVMNGLVPPAGYDQLHAAGMELGPHFVSHYCYALDEATLRDEIEANVAGLVSLTQAPDDVISAVWPCGFTRPAQQAIAADYFLSTRGYNINELEDASPSNFMNLKSFNSHEHVPFPPADLRVIADAAEAQGKWANLVLHAFTNDDGAIAYATTRDLWFAPIGTVVKYILQRDRTVIADYSQTSSTVAFTFRRLDVSGSALREFEPAFKATDVITLRVALEPSRYAGAVTVDGNPVQFEVRQESDGRFVYFNAPVSATATRTVSVALTAVPAILVVSPEAFDLTATAGEGVAPRTLAIGNAGGGTLPWTATVTGAGPSWVSVSPASGSSPGTVTVGINTSGLAPGTYQRNIEITSPNAANGAVSVPVVLRVVPPGTEQFTLDYPDRASLLAAGWDFVAQTSSGGLRDTEQTAGAVVGYGGGAVHVPVDAGDLWAGENNTRNTLFHDLPADWASIRVQLDFAPFQPVQQAGLALYQDDDNFVQVLRQFSGTQHVVFEHEVGGAPATLNEHTVVSSTRWFLRLDRQGQSGPITGLYSADGLTWHTLGSVAHSLVNPRLALVSGGSPGGYPTATFRSVEVQGATNWTPALATSVSSLNFVTAEGGTPTPQTFSISNAGGGTLVWEAAATGTGPAGLSVSPATGTGSGTVTVAVNASGLAPGTYARSVTVTASGASGSPVVIPVTLTVQAPPEPGVYPLTYGNRASLLAAGWDFQARTASGAGRNTEQSSGAVVSYTGTALQIPADHGDLWEGLNNTRNSLFRDLPSDWTSVRLDLSFAPTQVPQQAGLVVYDHDDHYVHVTRIFLGSPQVVFARETGGAAAVVGAATVTPNRLWLRLDRNVATNAIAASHSTDGGSTWTALGNVTQAFSAPRVGIVVGASSSGFPVATVYEVQVLTNVAPALATSAASLNFVTTVGETPAAQTLGISNAGGGTLTWQGSVTGSGPAWLGLSATSGTAPASVSVTANAAGLAAGTYHREIVVTASGASGSPVVIPVTLTVQAPPEPGVYPLTYGNRASLLAAGWDFQARTASGAGRNTEQSSGAVVSYTGTALQIPADHGDLWEGLNNTRNSLFRDLPSDWTSVRLDLSFAPTQVPQQAGLVVYDHDDHYVHVTRIFLGSPQVVFARETGGAAAVVGAATVTPNRLWLRLDRNVATNAIAASHSTDGGSTWTALGNVTQAFSAPRVGIVVGASSSGFPVATVYQVQVSTETP